MEWTFIVEGCPVPWKRPGQRGRRRHTDTKERDYRRQVAAAAIAAGVAAGVGPCALEVVVYLPDRRVRDGANILKGIEDALHKEAGERVLADDRITILTDTRCRLGGIDPMNPRAEITLRLVDAATIPGLVS